MSDFTNISDVRNRLIELRNQRLLFSYDGLLMSDNEIEACTNLLDMMAGSWASATSKNKNDFYQTYLDKISSGNLENFQDNAFFKNNAFYQIIGTKGANKRLDLSLSLVEASKLYSGLKNKTLYIKELVKERVEYEATLKEKYGLEWFKQNDSKWNALQDRIDKYSEKNNVPFGVYNDDTINDYVFIKTGWEKGVDNKWRYDLGTKGFRVKLPIGFLNNPGGFKLNELNQIKADITEIESKAQQGVITDSEATGQLGPLQQIFYTKEKLYHDKYIGISDINNLNTSPLTLSEIIDYPELFELYPNLKNYPVTFYLDDSGTNNSGAFNRKDNSFSINLYELDEINIKNLFLHEIQHSIQEIETFASGGNIVLAKELKKNNILYAKAATLCALKEKYPNDYLKQLKYYQALYNEKPDPQIETLANLNAKPLGISKLTPIQIYHRIAGEVEARNVSYRSRLSTFERKNLPINKTEDVDKNYQLIIENKSGISFNISPTPIFYSTIEKALETIDMEKATAGQWFAMLKNNGAKEAELDWLGWDEFVQGQASNNTILKSDIIKWANQNQIEITDIIKGKEDDYDPIVGSRYVEKIELIDNNTWYIELDNGKEISIRRFEAETEEEAIEAALDEYKFNFDSYSETKYSKYTLAEGKNYKELLLTMPSKVDKINNSDVFTTRHWDEPNILSHIRFNERFGKDGEKVLFIEELQSDWAQLGKKEGFKGNIKDLPDGFKILTPEDKKMMGYSNPHGFTILDNHGNVYIAASPTKEYAIEKTLERLNYYMIPDMPFKQTQQWVTLSLRRIIRYAAENGYDSIAWLNGDKQSERYSLSPKLEAVYVDYNIDSTYSLQIKYKDKEFNEEFDFENIDDTKLRELVGINLSEKIIKRKGYKSGPLWKFDGDNLEIGGEGMKTFYDSIIPNCANKLIKKFNSTVTDIIIDSKPNITIDGIDLDSGDIVDVNSKYIKMPGFSLTGSMVKTALQGLPLFQTAYHGSPYEFKTFSTEFIGKGESLDAQGYGLYFSDKQEVAEFYADKLSKNEFYINNEKWTDFSYKPSEVLKTFETHGKGAAIDITNKFVTQIIDDIQYTSSNKLTNINLYYNSLKTLKSLNTLKDALLKDSIFIKKNEHVYKVDLDDSKFISYEKPIGPVVKELIRKQAVEQGLYKTWDNFNGSPCNTIDNTWNIQEGSSAKQVYNNLSSVLSEKDNRPSNKNASEFLFKAGISGFKYESGYGVSNANETHFNYVVFDSSPIAVIEHKNKFFDKEKVKGLIEFNADNKADLTFFKGADVSTIVHEFCGHIGRRALEDMAKSDTSFKNDYDLVCTWAGVKNNIWNRNSEEKFARAFEKYLYKGSTKSKTHNNVFGYLKNCFKAIYNSKSKLKDINIDITPEVERVFDRLLGITNQSKPVSPIFSSKSYYNTENARKLAHDVKSGKTSSIKCMAKEMSINIPAGAIIIPVPNKSGKAEYTLELANEIARLTNSKVEDILISDQRKSLYELKKEGFDTDNYKFNFSLKKPVPDGFIIIVDNVISTGKTIDEVTDLIPGASISVHSIDESKFFNSKYREHFKVSILSNNKTIQNNENYKQYGQ